MLGYGRTGDTLPPALDGLLRLYERQLAAPPAARAAEARTTRPVAPLLRSVRHQRDPFNRSCPYYIDDAGQPSATRCVVGCVATALEQVLTYYRQPAALADTVFAHSSTHFTTTDVAPGTPIDWPHILDVYAEGQYSDAEARAVADLSLWCGQMAQMDWGTRESGAYVNRLAAPVSRSLGYGYVHYADSYQYRPDEWMDMLLAEIQGGRPVVYAGGIYAQSAHAFVLDGVDAEGRFHVNWGYGGAYDGYFRLDVLNPFDPTATGGTVGQAQGFFCNQEALLPTSTTPSPSVSACTIRATRRSRRPSPSSPMPPTPPSRSRRPKCSVTPPCASPPDRTPSSRPTPASRHRASASLPSRPTAQAPSTRKPCASTRRPQPNSR